MRKFLHSLLTISLLLFYVQSQAQVTIGTVDAGPYTPGSSIAATFTLGSACITPTNSFELYLSDATGNFVSTTPIGIYNGFYSTFVNGTIPVGTPAGTNYMVRVRSTSLGTFSAASGPIIISGATTAVQASLTSNRTLSTNPVTFGNCNTDETQTSTNYTFSNSSTAGATVTATIVNELNPGPATTLTFTPVNNSRTFAAALAHYTVIVKAVMPDLSVSTRAYFLINNIVRTAFATTTGNTVCFPTGSFSYQVTVDNVAGIGSNFPGNTYHIDWGDGTSSDYTLCDIITNSNRVGHSFTKSSCGLSYMSGTQTIYNAFGVNVSVVSPFCGQTGSPLSTPARVVSRPENRFSFPPVACLNDNVIFVNNSLPGQRASTNSAGCADNNVLYTWYVDGVVVPGAQDQPRTYNLQYTFTTIGQHTIRLTSNSDGGCQADDIEQTICIQNPPQPSFTLPATNLCLSSATLTPTNTSVIDNTCPNVAPPVYTWTVTPSAGVTFNANSATPTFSFAQIGVYNISLNIQSATCNRTTPVQEVVVNNLPQINMSGTASLCTKGGTFLFGPTGTTTQTTVTGTAKTLPDTYTWTVTGATTYSFVGTDGPNTQYPTINFSDYGTYVVTLVHKNNCGTETKSQTISFSQSPIPEVIVPPTTCYNQTINVTGSITNGTYASFSWSSSGGGTFSDPTSLTPVYTPSAADRNALSTTLTLTVNTGIPGNCLIVADAKTIQIFPNNTGTNGSQTICTGGAVAYTPASIVTTSTFRWTAVNADGNASGFAASGTGNINETSITNTNATANAVIVYTIVPEANGCDGVPFTYTVTVTPIPVITATVAQPTICDDTPAGITLNSNLGPAATFYTWSTSVDRGAVSGAPSQTTPITATGINNNLINQGTVSSVLTYVITPYNSNGCPGVPVSVSVQVDPALTTPNAGEDENICNSTTFTMKGNPITVGTGTWTLTSGQSGVVFADEHLYNTGVSGLVAGQNYVFLWTVTGGVCGSRSDDMSLYVNIPTVAGTTSTTDALPVCEAANTGTITLSGNLGDITRWQSSTDGGTTWIDIVNTTNTLTYSNITVATQYRAGVKNGDCLEQFSTPTTITVTPATTIANAGPDQILCNETTAQLSAVSALKTGETGSWTVSPALPNLVITDPTNRVTTVTGLSAGQSYTFTWTITGPSPCGPTRDDLVITDLQPLTNTITSSSTEVCYNQTITITGDVPTGGNGTYTYVWQSSTDGTNWNAIQGQTGKDLTYQLQATLNFRRIVSSSACTATSNVIRIIAQPPIGNNVVAADQSICTGIIPAPLTGSVPTGSDGNFNYQWQSSIDNGANWTNISGAVFAAYAPQALTATTQYRRIVSTITCNGALSNTSNAITITVRPNAKAEFTYALDNACAPFVINANNVRAVPYPDRNATYTWYANDVVIGTGITFPGYTITTSNTVVTIKLVTTPSTGCLPDQMVHDFSTSQAVAASYTQSATTGCGPLIVNFINTSSAINGVSFSWNFGNGVTSSQAMPPAVTFQPDPTGKDTTYTVTLTATTVCGASTQTSTVFVKAKPVSVFSPSRTTGCSPLTVTFSNTSPGSTNTYYYDFGDGTLLTKTDKSDVQHTFTTTVVRDFVVKMIAENECGRDESSYTIRVSPNTVRAELVVNANESVGCAPFTVNFYNNSSGANSFRYDFGDGSTLLTRSAPEVVRHTFATAGTYNVTLLASNGCSENTTTETITVLPQPVTGFTADVTLGCPGLAVQFRNTSVDGVSYLWDFGDGTTSNEFAPRHVFTGPQEYYTVSLTATNSLGCTGTTTMNQYIHIVPPPVAQFNVLPSTVINIPNYTFRFEDASTNNPTIWAWDFGDGTNSSLKNPSHTYLDTGKYVVTLRVANQQGCFTTTFKTVTIVGVPGYLFVPNSFMPGSDTPELRTFIAKGSGIKTWRMTVFNKWGQTLWETTQLNEGRPVEGWDGMFNGVPQPQGVFFWKIDVEFVNGTAWKGMTYDSSAPKKTGVIHLIR